MDKTEAKGFFPERVGLRARRLRASADQPADPSRARAPRRSMAVVWFAVFLPLFLSTLTSGWNGRLTARSLQLILYGLWLGLAACAVLAAVGLWRGLLSKAAR